MDCQRSAPARLFLIGYRGSGKSTVARELATRLGWRWVDSDDLIEQQAGTTIQEIFAAQGESVFRDLEEQAVAQLSASAQTVVALGGGAVLREANRDCLVQAGPVVWLTAPAEALGHRLASDASTTARRPSLTGRGVVEEIAEVLAERAPLYRACATLTIDTQGKTPAQIAEEVVAGLGLAQAREPGTNL